VHENGISTTIWVEISSTVMEISTNFRPWINLELFHARGWKKVTGQKMVGEKRWVKKEKGKAGPG